ncbi:putative UDP-glucuronosyl/UDP-glucosyltransferase [Helianthus debilis subsp. tardiflorus]
MASNLHFLIIPLMCPGHLIPMVDMAKLIAQHSVTVTVIITPGNAKRYGAVPPPRHSVRAFRLNSSSSSSQPLTTGYPMDVKAWTIYPRNVIIRERIREAELGAYGTLINSFDELETRYIDQFRKVKQGRVWCIGPFSNSNKNDLDKAQRGSKDSINNHECMKWLDSQRNRSVIYVCLGSLTRLTPLQFIELALGLEDSQFAFILVVKGGSRTEEIEQWLGENGFESRVKAVGAFLTHCGWNSTIEGVCAGVPMITWPQFAEQFFNERLVVQVLGTGVGVGAQRVMHLDDDNRDAIQVKSEDVCKAVKMVMDEGREGEERREKATYF